jgi:hypothetical protein
MPHLSAGHCCICEIVGVGQEVCCSSREAVLYREDQMKQISRRAVLGTAAAMAATPALAEGCQVGPPQHHEGPLVFTDCDQLELDASYDQV